MRVLSGMSAQPIREQLAQDGKASYVNGDIVIVSLNWKSSWSGYCSIDFAQSHQEGWHLADFTGTKIIGGIDSSVADAFAKYPDIFQGIPQPDPKIGRGPNEDTFNATDKTGSAQITYAVDPAVTKGRASSNVKIAGEVHCGGHAKTAAALTKADAN